LLSQAEELPLYLHLPDVFEKAFQSVRHKPKFEPTFKKCVGSVTMLGFQTRLITGEKGNAGIAPGFMPSAVERRSCDFSGGAEMINYSPWKPVSSLAL